MRTLASFRNVHQGGTIVVCGCGESLRGLEHPERFVTIGVNDVGRMFQPDYLVVVNPRDQFASDRFQFVEQSRARYLFTQLDLDVPHPQVVKFALGVYGGVDLSDPEVLHFTQNSPYVAMCLAAHMGATRIGLIGVDFTGDHFFGATGEHPLATQLPAIDAQYRLLAKALRARGIEVFNLSRVSRLTAFPKCPVAEFTGHKQVAGLKIVSYATTPVAGVPAVLARAINAHTPHTARCVWATNGYGNGVVFNGDVEWSREPDYAAQLIAEADLVIVHNGKADPAHQSLLDRKPVITMAHNYLWNVDTRFVDRGSPGVVIGQYQATLPEFAGWHIVPNPVPIWEEAFRPGMKNAKLTICYTPSGPHERYAPDHPLYWHSKGFQTTTRVLAELAARYGIAVEATGQLQVSHAESLAMKRRAHIVIDECVTGSYHRNSLEGLSTGCIVVNGVGQLPAVVDVFRHCARNGDGLPFVSAALDTLSQTLAALAERDPLELTAAGQRNREWMETHWEFSRQWSEFWVPVVDRALGRTTNGSTRAHVLSKTGPVTAIIPHGGADRLPLLRTTLEQLRRHDEVAAVVVVEMDSAPHAAESCREFGAQHVFVWSDGPFHKTRAMNAGLPFVSTEMVLWLDGDLILPPAFLTRAVAEMRARALDCLAPWTSVRYLSEDDSRKVATGDRAPWQCSPVNAFFTRQGACGGAVLVRRDFVERYGGLCEEFIGWGGEDNAWFHKCFVLGRAAITDYDDQHLYHLYHLYSGGYSSGEHLERNPHYRDNYALLQRIRAVRDPSTFLELFPPPRKEARAAPADAEPARIGFDALTVARAADLTLPEFAAFNHDRDYPRMRRWELPFVLMQARLSNTMAVLDCTINPVDLAARLTSLYPHLIYRHCSPIKNGAFELPFGVPDEAFDRVFCINTLEHLLASQREALLEELARKLKLGGLLVVTCDQYFDSMWSVPAVLRTGVIRADRSEVFNGWNRVHPEALVKTAAHLGFEPLTKSIPIPSESDASLYRNVEPYPHACTGFVFRKGEAPATQATRRIVLALLTWNTRDISLDSVHAYVREAAMLQRMGHDPFLLVCDNGSVDGTREALSVLDSRIPVPHRFILNANNRGSSAARNQMIDAALESDADYILFLDGDIEVVPFSSYAMLCKMEASGRLLGCLGAPMNAQSPHREHTSRYLFSIAETRDSGNLLAWTQYGMFRKEVFQAGVRFEESGPFLGEGWGCEDNDLAFQMSVKGFRIHQFPGMTYLHRAINSSLRVMRGMGLDPNDFYVRRKALILDKWRDTPSIADGPLRVLRDYQARL